jgi:cytosine/uracil/thiamine/allantoin permease
VLLTKQFKTKNEGKTNFERKKTMSLIGLVIVLVVVGVVLWLINSFIPMQSTIKNILNVVVVIVMILWLLSAFGLIESFEKIHI